MIGVSHKVTMRVIVPPFCEIALKTALISIPFILFGSTCCLFLNLYQMV